VKYLVGFTVLGLLSAPLWCLIIWTINKYQPSPIWGVIVIPFFILIAIITWLTDKPLVAGSGGKEG